MDDIITWMTQLKVIVPMSMNIRWYLFTCSQADSDQAVSDAQA
ncbi:MAG: hypothetical protein WC446_04430 [Candidatus Paceibacterota bacterium]